MRRVLPLLAVFALLSLAFAPAPLPKPRKLDAKALQHALTGEWQLASSERTIRGVRRTFKANTRVRIENGTWRYIYPASEGPAYPIRLDTTKGPAQMDVLRVGGKAVFLSGIVKVEGDTVKFCYNLPAQMAKGAARPTSFEPRAEGVILMTLVRAPAKK